MRALQHNGPVCSLLPQTMFVHIPDALHLKPKHKMYPSSVPTDLNTQEELLMLERFKAIKRGPLIANGVHQFGFSRVWCVIVSLIEFMESINRFFIKQERLRRLFKYYFL